ncbi:unnamed protein product [Haemonchus placei]|uniref:MBD_C domain-containing protein n=1 Tax=Haemonchus placei TaxID=6290 RepID=A0A0N4WP70_HAEPC|nr:unnamed protein product [Haemonchus placei]
MKSSWITQARILFMDNVRERQWPPTEKKAPESSPVHITIETDPSKSFYVGPYDRTRIDLVEEFHPLQTASVAQGAQLQELRRRAAGVKSVNNQPTLVEASPMDFEMNDRDAVSSESSPKPQRTRSIEDCGRSGLVVEEEEWKKN